MDLAANIAAYVVNPNNRAQIADDLATYYRGESPVPDAFRFDDLAQRASPDHFGPVDFEAIAALGQPLGRTTIGELGDRFAPELRQMLLALDMQVRFMPIWEAPESVWSWPDAPLAQLFLFLRDEVRGVGGIGASKLIAIKYPELVPIRDQITERVIGTDHSGPWARMMQSALHSEVRETLYELSQDSVPQYVSLLRRLGVALWMAGKQHPDTQIATDGTLHALSAQ